MMKPSVVGTRVRLIGPRLYLGYAAGLQRVVGAHDRDTFAADRMGVPRKRFSCSSDVGANGLVQIAGPQVLDRGTDAIEDARDEPFGGLGMQRGIDGATLLVTEHHNHLGRV